MSSNGASASSKELWHHSAPHTTQIYDFMQKSNQNYGSALSSYHDLWQWSVSEPAKFWEHVWHYTAIKAHNSYSTVSGPGRGAENQSVVNSSNASAGARLGQTSLPQAQLFCRQQA